MNLGFAALRAFGVTVAVFLSGGCALVAADAPPPHVVEEQLPGHWVAEGDCKATLDINSDKTFAFTDFPVAYDGPGTEPVTSDSAGKWRLAEVVKDLAPQNLALFPDAEKEAVNRLTFATAGKGEERQLVLRQEVGDPDYSRKCEFHKR